MDINFFETLETNFELFISNVKKDNLLKIPNSDNEYFPKNKNGMDSYIDTRN